MNANPNVSFDRSKLTLSCLEPIPAEDFEQISNKIQEQIKFIVMRFHEQKVDTKQPYDKELIILPRQQTYIQKITENKFQNKNKTRMIWDEQTKGWILRRDKKKQLLIPPIIEATKADAYEDVFRKREMEVELDKHKKDLRTLKKQKLKQKKLQTIRKQI